MVSKKTNTPDSVVQMSLRVTTLEEERQTRMTSNRMKSLRRHPWDFQEHLEQLTAHIERVAMN